MWLGIWLLNNRWNHAQCEDEYGNTALHRACAGGCQAVVELLAAEHERYNPITQVISDLKNKWHSTPFMLQSLVDTWI